MPVWRRQPQIEIPGGPVISKLPDLVVDSVSLVSGSTQVCYGNNIGKIQFTVKIRNIGFGTAVMGGFGSPWFAIWSIIAASSWNPIESGGYDLKELPSGSIAVFNHQPLVRAVVAPDQKSSSIGVGVEANLSHVIAEKSYDNNYREKQIKLGGVFCP
jgi:hypothetical protein